MLIGSRSDVVYKTVLAVVFIVEILRRLNENSISEGIMV